MHGPVPTSRKVAVGTGPLYDKKVPVMQELRYETCKLFKVICLVRPLPGDCFTWPGVY